MVDFQGQSRRADCHYRCERELLVDQSTDRSASDLGRWPLRSLSTAVYLLRRAANAPLQQVAVRFRVSPSRVSKIQRTVESRPLTPEQVDAFTRCKVKD
ncbi:MAG: hypothetical protein AAB308_13960 [Nitrospirota bacterium]